MVIRSSIVRGKVLLFVFEADKTPKTADEVLKVDWGGRFNRRCDGEKVGFSWLRVFVTVGCLGFVTVGRSQLMVAVLRLA